VQFVLHYTKGGGSSTHCLINDLTSKHRICLIQEWKPQNYSGAGKDLITNGDKGNESFW